MYEYFGYRDQVNLWIEQVRALTWETIRTKAIDSVKNYLQLSKNKWTSWDVSTGEYAFQLYVPFDVMDLSFLQRLNLQKYIDYARSAIARMIPDEEWTLIDTVYSYWPSKDIYNWIPPFKSKKRRDSSSANRYARHILGLFVTLLALHLYNRYQSLLQLECSGTSLQVFC